MADPLLIGWREYADFPEWGLTRVKVKVDTGAKTSALHAPLCRLEESADGPLLRFWASLYRREKDREVEVAVPMTGLTKVRNTGGVSQARFVVETVIRLGDREKRVRFTLADRSRMLTPVILGRQALAGDFIVDAGRKFLTKRE